MIRPFAVAVRPMLGNPIFRCRPGLSMTEVTICAPLSERLTICAASPSIWALMSRPPTLYRTERRASSNDCGGGWTMAEPPRGRRPSGS